MSAPSIHPPACFFFLFLAPSFFPQRHLQVIFYDGLTRSYLIVPFIASASFRHHKKMTGSDHIKPLLLLLLLLLLLWWSSPSPRPLSSRQSGLETRWLLSQPPARWPPPSCSPSAQNTELRQKKSVAPKRRFRGKKTFAGRGPHTSLLFPSSSFPLTIAFRCIHFVKAFILSDLKHRYTCSSVRVLHVSKPRTLVLLAPCSSSQNYSSSLSP